MKIFETKYIKQIDSSTIKKEQINSSELMERAGQSLFEKIRSIVNIDSKILILAGPGNNGGDALVVSRLLLNKNYKVKTLTCFFNKNISKDTNINLKKLYVCDKLEDTKDLKNLDNFDFIIDGLFGSGLNRPIEGQYADIITFVNNSKSKVISIDIPSGLMGEDNRKNIKKNIIQANYTLTIQIPKLSFLLFENEKFVGEIYIIDINLDKEKIESLFTPYNVVEKSYIKSIIKNRNKFSNKGNFGRILNIAGSYGMAGAAILSSKASLRMGAGLVFCRTTKEINDIIQISSPETIVKPYENDLFYDNLDLDKYNAICVGPGLGTNKTKESELKKLLLKRPKNLLIDADALNLISKNKNLLDIIPQNSIITPHPGEFSRLTEKKYETGYERLQDAISFAKTHKIYIVLKGYYTATITPEGICYFNPTGNSGMSTAGSGDVLSGIIASLLGQGYSSLKACILGTYIHGYSADLALKDESQESLIASDIIKYIGKSYNKLK